LAPAENRTDPSPCPSVGEPIVNHGVSVLAAHWQSRLVVMRSDPEPPAAPTDGLSLVTCKAHLVDGALMVSVCEEDPQADATSAATTSIVAAVNERDVPVRRTVATSIVLDGTFLMKVELTEQGVCRRARRRKARVRDRGCRFVARCSQSEKADAYTSVSTRIDDCASIWLRFGSVLRDPFSGIRVPRSDRSVFISVLPWLGGPCSSVANVGHVHPVV
jgi:hypothetical protein